MTIWEDFIKSFKQIRLPETLNLTNLVTSGFDFKDFFEDMDEKLNISGKLTTLYDDIIEGLPTLEDIESLIPTVDTIKVAVLSYFQDNFFTKSITGVLMSYIEELVDDGLLDNLVEKVISKVIDKLRSTVISDKLSDIFINAWNGVWSK